MPISTITVGSANWIQKANKAIDQNRRVKLVVKGPEAFTAAEALRRAGVSGITGAEEVVIAATIVIGVIAVAGLGTVAAVCLYGMSKGYTIKAKHKTHGPLPFDDELFFDLRPPT
jgi:hypothetical protein